MDFITVDFEIANSDLSSACSLGIVFVKDNQIIDKQHFYIQPPEMTFDASMIKVHGITKAIVQNEMKFDVVWEVIKDYFNGDQIIIAHNAQFDMSVLHSTLRKYDILLPEFEYIDSISISTKALKGHKVGNSLKERLECFNLEILDHHDALADAVACAQLVISSIKSKNKKSLMSYCNTYKSIPIRNFSDLKPNKTFGKKKFGKVKISDIAATVETFDETHELFGKSVVFTGDLQTIDRKDAMQKVVNLGGFVKSGVSSKTNYLIVGEQDKSLVGDDGISSKERKANELISKGVDIKIINESVFLELLR